MRLLHHEREAMCPASFQPEEGGSSYVEEPGWKKDDIPEQGSTQALNKNSSAYAKVAEARGSEKVDVRR